MALTNAQTEIILKKRVVVPLCLWVSDDNSRCLQGWKMHAPAVKDCNNEKHLMSSLCFIHTDELIL